MRTETFRGTAAASLSGSLHVFFFYLKECKIFVIYFVYTSNMLELELCKNWVRSHSGLTIVSSFILTCIFCWCQWIGYPVLLASLKVNSSSYDLFFKEKKNDLSLKLTTVRYLWVSFQYLSSDFGKVICMLVGKPQPPPQGIFALNLCRMLINDSSPQNAPFNGGVSIPYFDLLK